jgi:large subunit ribosomal protein L25
MEQKEINLNLRTRTGKNAARQCRAEGLIPGIVYGKGIDPVPVTLAPKELGEALAGDGGQNTLLKVKGAGELDGSMVIVADLLKSSLKRNILHVDLHKLNMGEKIRLDVPVKLIGNAQGVKDGGLMEFLLHSVEIECLPTQIPERFDVDVANLTIGHSIHVSDLQLPAGVKALGDGRTTIVSIIGKAKDDTAAAAE